MTLHVGYRGCLWLKSEVAGLWSHGNFVPGSMSFEPVFCRQNWCLWLKLLQLQAYNIFSCGKPSAIDHPQHRRKYVLFPKTIPKEKLFMALGSHVELQLFLSTISSLFHRSLQLLRTRRPVESQLVSRDCHLRMLHEVAPLVASLSILHCLR